MLRTTLIGAGAIGGMIASRLQRGGTPVSLLVRPGQAAALADCGLCMREDGQQHITWHKVATDASELGVQDIVFICVKAPALVQSVARFAALIGPDTVIVPAMNGIPWWFLEGLEGPLRGRQLRTVDPYGEIARLMPAAQTLGCVVYLAAYVNDQREVVPTASNRLVVGEALPQADRSRFDRVVEILRSARFDVEFSPSIRRELWIKLWGNLFGNPIGALTGCTIAGTLSNKYTLRLITSIMEEAQTLAQALGIHLGMDIAQRLQGMRQLVGIKSSMLQDLEAGRALELDSIIGAVSEIGDLIEIDTPFTDAVLGLVQQRAETAKLWSPPQLDVTG